MLKLLSNDTNSILDGDLFIYNQPLKHLELDDDDEIFSSQEFEKNASNDDDDYENVDEELNILNLVINDVYLNELKTKSSVIYWNNLNQENDKCDSQFEGLFAFFFFFILIFVFFLF